MTIAGALVKHSVYDIKSTLVHVILSAEFTVKLTRIEAFYCRFTANTVNLQYN